MALRVAIEDAILTPLRAVQDDVEYLPAQGMKRVGDANGTGHFAGARCSCYGDRKHVLEGEPKSYAPARHAHGKIYRNRIVFKVRFCINDLGALMTPARASSPACGAYALPRIP